MVETIEQYEETKITLAKRKLHLDRGTYLGPQVEKVQEVISHLEADLLQYRREHNIFEVGDLVVIKASPFWPEDYVIHTVEQEHIGKWYMSAWRHATPEEIQAGRRLEVCGG